MRYRCHEVAGRGVACVHQPAQAVVIAHRAQRRQAGHLDTGPLRGLPQRALPTGMVLTVTAVVVVRRIVGRLARGPVGYVGYDDAFAGGEVTLRGIGADGVRIQQTEEKQAQAQHTPQNRCRAAPLHTGRRPGRNHAVILTRPESTRPPIGEDTA